MRPHDPKEKPFISVKTRAYYIKRCRELTHRSDDPEVPNGAFPLDHEVKFEDLSNQELLEYIKAYKWAMDEKNFRTYR